MLCVGWNALPELYRFVLEFQVRILSAIQVQVILVHLIDIFLNSFYFFIELLRGQILVILHLIKVAHLVRDTVGSQEFDRSRAKFTSELLDQLPVVYELLKQAICLYAFVD